MLPVGEISAASDLEDRSADDDELATRSRRANCSHRVRSEAWGVAGLLSIPNTLDLTARRAETMDAASSGDEGLLFVRGLSRDAVEKLCERHDTAIAIVNPGDAFILGGSRMALEGLAREARAMNAARAVELPIATFQHDASTTSRLFKAPGIGWRAAHVEAEESSASFRVALRIYSSNLLQSFWVDLSRPD
jgi:hypothetical protein